MLSEIWGQKTNEAEATVRGPSQELIGEVPLRYSEACTKEMQGWTRCQAAESSCKESRGEEEEKNRAMQIPSSTGATEQLPGNNPKFGRIKCLPIYQDFSSKSLSEFHQNTECLRIPVVQGDETTGFHIQVLPQPALEHGPMTGIRIKQ